MPFIPHTAAERQAMLAAIGVDQMDDLFQDVPARYRYPDLGLPPALSEMDVLKELQHLANSNLDTNAMPLFLGAGAYRHWIPSVVDHVISRSEFATAYTPYQPEVSQGTLQAIFEYQSMICDLTGMDVANASHYDGATATAEAVIQAYNVFRKKRNQVVISPTLHPHARAVLRTYTQGMNMNIVGDDNIEASVDDLVAQIDANTACLIVQSPNFLGQIEDLASLKAKVAAQNAKTLLVVATNPISLGLFTPPGAYDADIVLGEGQPLGLGLNFGGPYLGFYATRKRYTRQMAGRIIGQTKDMDGKRAYVMTLTTREQHIRREKATSNICTNQGLMALAATVYMAALGKHGLRQIAELNYHKAHYAAQVIDALPGFSVVQEKPFFNEFSVRCPAPVADVNAFLASGKAAPAMIGGYDLGRDYATLSNQMLVAVTEMNSRSEIDDLSTALAEFRS